MSRPFALIVFLACLFLIYGFGFMPKKSIGFVFHNDSGAEVYRKEIITDKNKYVDHHHGFDVGLKNKASNGEISFLFERAPKFVLVRWKSSLEAPYNEKKVDLTEVIKSYFEGTLLFSLLPSGEVEVSKVEKNSNGKKTCSGYIFSELHYVAKENLRRIQARGWESSDDYWCNQMVYLDYQLRMEIDGMSDD